MNTARITPEAIRTAGTWDRSQGQTPRRVVDAAWLDRLALQVEQDDREAGR
jgi:hypothetical protein